MELYEVIRSTYKEYLEYLQKNPRVPIPQHIHDPAQSIGKVHASALGRCPLAAAKKREVEVQETLSTLHLMQQGVRDAEPLQEAMYWRYSTVTLVEHSVEREHFRGRLDILYGHNVIEIKRRDAWKKDSSPDPRLTDVYQLIAYAYMTGFESIHLCLMTRFNLHFWELVKKGNGFLLVDEHGNEWKNAYNTPSYLNFSVILHESRKHLEYLEGIRTEDPFPNYLNMIVNYECGRWEGQERPKKYKTSFNGETQRNANFIPSCQFWCHGEVPKSGMIEVEEIEYNSKEYECVTGKPSSSA